MARSSKVWSNMLGTKTVNGPWVLNLQDDTWDGADLIQLLYIIHGQLGAVDKSPSVGKLFRVLLAAKQFQLYEAIKPIAKVWMENAEKQMMTYYERCRVVTSPGYHLYLNISWELGETNRFAKAATRLLKFSALTNEGLLVIPSSILNGNPKVISNEVFLSEYKSGIALERKGVYRQTEIHPLDHRNHCGPKDFADVLRARRDAAIKAILAFVDRIVQPRMRRNGTVSCTMGQKVCDHAVLGEYWDRMDRIRGMFFTGKEESCTILESVQTLTQVLSGVFHESLSLGSEHQQCSPHHQWKPFIAWLSTEISELDPFLPTRYREEMTRKLKVVSI